MKKRLFVYGIIAALLSSCVKSPSYPIEPKIVFESVSSTFVKLGYADTISFSFTDGDGDLNVNMNQSNLCQDTNLCKFRNGDTLCLYAPDFNIFLVDSRDSCLTPFASGTIESSGKFDDISGQIEVIKSISSRKCIIPTPGCALDTVQYWIVIRDRSMHFSNWIQTPPIIVDGNP